MRNSAPLSGTPSIVALTGTLPFVPNSFCASCGNTTYAPPPEPARISASNVYFFMDSAEECRVGGRLPSDVDVHCVDRFEIALGHRAVPIGLRRQREPLAGLVGFSLRIQRDAHQQVGVRFVRQPA